jgi:hypothetical protein
MTEERARPVLQLYAPPALTAAVKRAAERELTTMSEYVRRTLIARLRAEGIDPTVSSDAVGRPSAG